MARINGVSSARAGLYVKIAYHFTRRSIAKLTGRQTERMIEPLEMYAHVPVLFKGYAKLEQAAAVRPAASVCAVTSLRERSNLRGAVRGQPHHDERTWPCVAGLATVGSWPGCRFAASPAPSPAALLFLGRMHHADCAHVAGGAEPHDGKARNWRLEGGIDHAAPAHRPDLEATGNDDGDCPHMGMDDNLDVPVIELGLAQINRHGAHTCVDPGETAHLPAALEANLAHRGRDLQRLLTPPRGRSEFDGRRQAADHRGEVSLGTGPEQSIEGFLKAAEIHLAAGQESLQEVDPALLEVLRDRGLGLGREPFVVHASRLSPDAHTDIRAGPAPGPEAHPQFAIARTRSRYDPRDCYRNPCPAARVAPSYYRSRQSKRSTRRGATSPAVATCR